MVKHAKVPASSKSFSPGTSSSPGTSLSPGTSSSPGTSLSSGTSSSPGNLPLWGKFQPHGRMICSDKLPLPGKVTTSVKLPTKRVITAESSAHAAKRRRHNNRVIKSAIEWELADHGIPAQGHVHSLLHIEESNRQNGIQVYPYEHRVYNNMRVSEVYSGILFESSHWNRLTVESQVLCEVLYEDRYSIPQHSPLCCDAKFRKTMDKLYGQNEARIIHDIGSWVVPRAETLETDGAKSLCNLIEGHDRL
jgi:hypothetical protein